KRPAKDLAACAAKKNALVILTTGRLMGVTVIPHRSSD
ncbi:hypothetical protein ABID58_005807, partial [Bradyrhizobium sp. S3.2.6]